MKQSTAYFLFLLCGLTLLLAGKTHAQQSIHHIALTYEKGEFENVVTEVGDYLAQENLSIAKRAEALQLLTKAHLFLNQNEQAADSYQALLKLSPRFQPEAGEPLVFQLLSKQFEARAKVLFDYSLASTLSSGELINAYTVSGREINKLYLPSLGTKFGVGINFLLSRKIYFSAGLELANRRMAISQTSKYWNPGHSTDSVTQTLTYQESMTFMEVPLSLKKHFGNGKKQLFVRAGATPAWMMAASRRKVEFKRTTKAGDSPVYEEPPSNLIYQQRQNLNMSLFWAFGISRKGKNGNLLFEVRRNHGLFNLVDASTRYKNSKDLILLQLVDDDFKLNSWSFNIGYARPIKYKIYSTPTKQ